MMLTRSSGEAGQQIPMGVVARVDGYLEEDS